ncbi:MAG: recombinase family protein [Robiginitomaculum sp.]|nr:recombinase family protein [Robiginitomaculum sp.]
MQIRSEISAAGGELMSPSIEFSDDPSAQLPEKMMALIVEQERINNAKRGTSRMKARMKNGHYVFPAPPAYKYVKSSDGNGGKVLVRKEPQATILADALNQFARGGLASQMEVKRYLDAHPGYPKGKIGKQRIRDLLTRVVNAGYIEYEPWGIALTKANHEPLISYETYLKIQERLKTKPKHAVRLDVNPEFALRGHIHCADCNQPYRAANSRGRNKHYAYFVCQTKECKIYGKSIRKEKIEAEFITLLDNLTPSADFVNMIKKMMRVIWERETKGLKTRQRSALATLTALETKMAALIDRTVQATQPALIAAYEGEISNLESQRILKVEQLEALTQNNNNKTQGFDEAYRTALRFFKNPRYLWDSGHISHRKALLRMTFADHLTYCREKGYRTAKTTLPFLINQTLSSNKGDKIMNFTRKENMVPHRGHRWALV